MTASIKMSALFPKPNFESFEYKHKERKKKHWYLDAQDVDHLLQVVRLQQLRPTLLHDAQHHLQVPKPGICILMYTSIFGWYVPGFGVSSGTLKRNPEAPDSCSGGPRIGSEPSVHSWTTRQGVCVIICEQQSLAVALAS